MTTEDIMKLIEANKLMADIIDKMFAVLAQHLTIKEIEDIDVLQDIHKASVIMKDYE